MHLIPNSYLLPHHLLGPKFWIFLHFSTTKTQLHYTLFGPGPELVLASMQARPWKMVFHALVTWHTQAAPLKINQTSHTHSYLTACLCDWSLIRILGRCTKHANSHLKILTMDCYIKQMCARVLLHHMAIVQTPHCTSAKWGLKPVGFTAVIYQCKSWCGKPSLSVGVLHQCISVK